MTKNLPSQRTAVDLAADSSKRSRLPEILRNWCHEIQAHGIAGVVVTVPDPLDPFVNRRCVAGAHPTSLLEALRNWNVVVMPTGQSMGRIADSAFTHTQLPALGLQSWACWRATMPFGHGQGRGCDLSFMDFHGLRGRWLRRSLPPCAWHGAGGLGRAAPPGQAMLPSMVVTAPL